jgi:hypothetical protein
MLIAVDALAPSGIAVHGKANLIDVKADRSDERGRGAEAREPSSAKTW